VPDDRYSKPDLGRRLPELVGAAQHTVIDAPPGHIDVVAAVVNDPDVYALPTLLASSAASAPTAEC